ncbi:GntR family transcriptional regulator [Roseateles violae]|uniref:GntR family transcriptional regulator n=1 Tax=Roseateles violae TaxID=3058042 RepID=A0ABT8DXM7_9BURK|nr:GntR family transcriptional regulator [Pelomonas sp. PFR6]MDN3921466.1 GntR family transcriptional regulator [Pelomonas sp. PFR6]
MATRQPINAPTYLRLRDQIRDDIVAGVWALGSHVTLAELGAHYQVSNVPVREALLQLQGEGIIEMRMNRGAVIPPVDAKFIDDTYHLRGALQSMLARLACVRASDAQMRTLEALALAYEDAAGSGEAAAAVAANREFHHHLDSMADNAQALEVLQARSSLVDAFRRVHGYGQGRLDKVIAQHRKIVKAIVRRDAEAASQAVLAHTDSSRQDLLDLLKRARPS